MARTHLRRRPRRTLRLLSRGERLTAILNDLRSCWDTMPAPYQDTVLGVLRLAVLVYGRRPAA